MNTERREEQAGGFGDIVMVVLAVLVVMALVAGIFLWFFATEAIVTSPTPVPLPAAPQPAAPKTQKEAESPFGDDDAPPPSANVTPIPPGGVKPVK